jgi:hypothetical protein
MKPEGHSPCSQQSATGPILGKMNPAHDYPPYLFQIQANIIFPSMLRSDRLTDNYLLKKDSAHGVRSVFIS